MKKAKRNEKLTGILSILAATTPLAAQAAPVEGEFGNNTAILLVVLGVWALLMGVRNLRTLRYKSMVPNRERSNIETDPANGVD